jgi:hypothetical protein
MNSNDLSVVQTLPASLKNINLLDTDADMTTLGVQWDASKDEIKYKIVIKFGDKITNHNIL